VADDLSRLQFTVENAGTAAAPATLTLEGLPAGRYEVQFDGEVLATLQGGEAEVRLPVSADQHEVLIHHLEPTQ
jgi:hypothetical protein